MKKEFLHSMFIDFNSFFASAEQALRPELRGKPVVVVPLMAETTCCIAASQEAKRFGIKTGTSVHEARRMCHGLLVVEAHPEPYIHFQRDLNKVIESCGVYPNVESIDEVHCELWGEWMEEDAAVALAKRIKKSLAEIVSPWLTCSIGIAPNRFLAKTASNMQKPDGLVVIRRSDLPHILHQLKLRDLYGIGPGMEARMEAHCVDTVAHLCALSREMVRNIWGSVEGERFYDSLHGKPTINRHTENRSLGHSHVLPPELRTEKGVRSVLHRLTQKAAMRLRSKQWTTSRLSFFVKYAGGRLTWSDEIHFNPTQDTFELLRTLDTLWKRRQRAPGFTPLATGINFLDICTESNTVPALFDREKAVRRQALLAVVDRLNIKKGKNTVYFAGAHGAVDYTPMRIAFNRIPDPDTER